VILTFYHGTDVPSAEAVRRTGLRPRADWRGRPEDHWILTDDRADAWTHACAQAGRSGDAPVVLAFGIPDDQWSDYILSRWEVGAAVTYYSLSRPLPGSMTRDADVGESPCAARQKHCCLLRRADPFGIF
jgi:hypothetical protein